MAKEKKYYACKAVRPSANGMGVCNNPVPCQKCGYCENDHSKAILDSDYVPHRFTTEVPTN